MGVSWRKLVAYWFQPSGAIHRRGSCAAPNSAERAMDLRARQSLDWQRVHRWKWVKR
jgi:hypothetical protein